MTEQELHLNAAGLILLGLAAFCLLQIAYRLDIGISESKSCREVWHRIPWVWVAALAGAVALLLLGVGT